MMLNNHLADADKALEEASREVAARDIDFAGGEHDLRGCFALVGAIMGLLNGMASLENNQLDTVLERVWTADELLSADGEWAGRTVLRGLCLLVAGVVQIMQGSVTRGVWQVLRSWLWLRYLESDGLNFEGHERGCVRSTALLALGVFNLFTSMLPPSAMRTAGWVTGFKGGRETALGQLQKCWEEGGIQAPFAGLVLVGVAVDVSSFLGEPRAQREAKHMKARRILDWAAKQYPGAFFFDGLEAGYLAAVQDLAGGVRKLEAVGQTVANLPAFLFMVHLRTATFQASLFEWAKAGEAFHGAVEVHRKVGRRAACPTLALNAHLCYVLAGDKDKADETLELSRSYRHEKKKWSGLDGASLHQAEIAYAKAKGATEDGALAKEAWHPKLTMYLKVCVVYRAVDFMQPEMVERFLAMVRAETEACGDDVDSRCVGLFIEAEAFRQREAWAEALEVASRVMALGPELSDKGRKSGALHFCQLIAAFAHHAQGNLGAAKDDLAKLDALGTGHFFRRQVDFKATHLRQLLGAELQDAYTSVSVAARSRARLVVEVPEGAESVEWDWGLAEYSINFVAFFTRTTEGTPSSSDRTELQRVEQHKADAGPFTGSLERPSPGRLELVFDNSFSLLRGKTVQCRVQPSSLQVKREDAL